MQNDEDMFLTWEDGIDTFGKASISTAFTTINIINLPPGSDEVRSRSKPAVGETFS